jgi:L-lactate dehydrogenase complex protein LldE
MIREGYRMLWPDRSFPDCYEVGEFLVDKLQVGGFRSRPVTNRRKVAFHRACHGRSLGLKMQQETLLSSMPGIELVAFDQAEQCCGFGGAISATHGKLSSGIGLEKLKQIEQSGATIIASGDMGCLMHLQGLIGRQDLKLQTRHYLELIAEEME